MLGAALGLGWGQAGAGVGTGCQGPGQGFPSRPSATRAVDPLKPRPPAPDLHLRFSEEPPPECCPHSCTFWRASGWREGEASQPVLVRTLTTGPGHTRRGQGRGDPAGRPWVPKPGVEGRRPQGGYEGLGPLTPTVLG